MTMRPHEPRPEARGPRPVTSPDGGVLNILKPVGMTSHDVVDAVRRIALTRRVGHTGTLDPGATGVLVVCVEKATRIAEILSDADKEYRVEVAFGASTDSGDAYGRVVMTGDPAGLSDTAVREALAAFIGDIDQIPPMASAVHVGGRRLYESARRGETVEVPPRRVHVYALELLEFSPGTALGPYQPDSQILRERRTHQSGWYGPYAWLHVRCSKGTYVRRLCSDLGERLGCGAHAAFMVRTKVGRYRIDDAATLDELAARAADGDLRSAMESPDAALSDVPGVDLSPPQRQAVMHGQGLPLFRVPGWQRLVGAPLVRLSDAAGLVALARVEEGMLKPFKVLRDS